MFFSLNNHFPPGDHSAHVAGLHFPQLFYFISFLTFFALPFMADAKLMKRVVQQLQILSLSW
jgi:alpha-1,2-glucosyltransferase